MKTNSDGSLEKIVSEEDLIFPWKEVVEDVKRICRRFG